jgi:hypothetical protein
MYKGKENPYKCTRERRIITNVQGKGESLQMYKGKENHYKCTRERRIIYQCKLFLTWERGIITNAPSFEPGKGESLQMHHPSSLRFGNQGKENYYKCVILHLWALGTRERGNHDQ